MPRKRETNHDLPKRTYVRKGKFYYVCKGVWTPLGADKSVAIQTAERLNKADYQSMLHARIAEREACSALREHVFTRDEMRCVYCGAVENLEIDHVVPHSMGGATSPGNLVVACCSCNSSKSDLSLAEFLQKLFSSVRAATGGWPCPSPSA